MLTNDEILSLWSGGTVGVTRPVLGSKKVLAFARAVEAASYERAAQWVDKRADDYDTEYGSTDPETGTREYPGIGNEYVFELREIADGLRALKDAK